MKIPNHCLRAGLVATAAVLLTSAGSLRAETIYGLTDTNQIFSFNSASPSVQTGLAAITGITAGQNLVGMDFRPATGQLYGLSYSSSTGAAQLYTLPLGGGAATAIGSGLSLVSGVPNGRVGFDFNPTADRIRLVFGDSRPTTSGGTDANYRLNPITGAIAATDTNVFYGSGDAGTGTDPIIVGVAYSNNTAGAASTTTYAYDFARDSIVTLGSVGGTPTSPNSGQLFTVGGSGITTDSADLGFDISGTTGIGYINARLNGTENLYTVNLTGGGLSLVGGFGATSVLDISVAVPEPSTYALCAVGLGALAFGVMRRRRVAA